MIFNIDWVSLKTINFKAIQDKINWNVSPKFNIDQDKINWNGWVLSPKFKAIQLLDQNFDQINWNFGRVTTIQSPSLFESLTKEVFEAPCSEECSICLNTHNKGDSITTQCKHQFGKECFQTFERNELCSKKCPLCRQTYKFITSYECIKTKST